MWAFEKLVKEGIGITAGYEWTGPAAGRPLSEFQKLEWAMPKRLHIKN